MELPAPRIYNTESRSITALAEQDVGLYVCGVTPYDTSHLGHAFTYTVFDVLVRYLRFLGRRVTYVQNVTDIDDDILLRAARNGEDWKALGDREYASFRESMSALGNLDPDIAPRATEHIPEIIDIVTKLLNKGLAYESGGSVYFEVARYPAFGRLFGEPYAAMLAIANDRGNFPADPLKRDPLDFVLWQHQKPGEPAWDSPWGPGRPGWHIECSAMSQKYLGDTITIHGGGEDLVFPHHDAEIAQSENVTGKPFARYWMHTAMVYSGEHKMSKSLGNMVFCADLLKSVTPDALRLYLLSHHYRQTWNHPSDAQVPTVDLAAELAGTLAGADDADEGDIATNGIPFLTAMASDLDTPRAIEELVSLARSQQASARRAARSLSRAVLGLSLT